MSPAGSAVWDTGFGSPWWNCHLNHGLQLCAATPGPARAVAGAGLELRLELELERAPWRSGKPGIAPSQGWLCPVPLPFVLRGKPGLLNLPGLQGAARRKHSRERFEKLLGEMTW